MTKNVILSTFLFCAFFLACKDGKKSAISSSNEEIGASEEVQDSVVFTAFVFGNQQVLTSNGEMYFKSVEGERIEAPYMGFCGTVPHYQLTIESLPNEFVLYSDETFFDHANEIVPEILTKISNEKADSVKWLNQQMSFDYTSNSTIGVFNGVAPDTYFIYKNGKVKISSDPSSTWYDSAVADRFQIVVERDGKKGAYGISDLLFSDLQPFNCYLARYTDLKGNQGYLSTDGQLFQDPTP